MSDHDGGLNDRSPPGFLDVCRYDVLWEVESSRTAMVMGCYRVRIASSPYSGTIRLQRHFNDKPRNIRRVPQNAASRICTASTSAIASGAFNLPMRGLSESPSSDSSLVLSGFSPLFRSNTVSLATGLRNTSKAGRRVIMLLSSSNSVSVLFNAVSLCRDLGPPRCNPTSGSSGARSVSARGLSNFWRSVLGALRKKRESRVDGVERGEGTTSEEEVWRGGYEELGEGLNDGSLVGRVRVLQKSNLPQLYSRPPVEVSWAEEYGSILEARKRRSDHSLRSLDLTSFADFASFPLIVNQA